MLLDKLDEYIYSIKMDEEIKLKGLSIFELTDLLVRSDNKDGILARLDEETRNKLEKMSEGGLI